MARHEEQMSQDQTLVKIWDLRSMKNKLDWSTALYLFYVLSVLALGVFLLTV